MKRENPRLEECKELGICIDCCVIVEGNIITSPRGHGNQSSLRCRNRECDRDYLGVGERVCPACGSKATWSRRCHDCNEAKNEAKRELREKRITKCRCGECGRNISFADVTAQRTCGIAGCRGPKTRIQQQWRKTKRARLNHLLASMFTTEERRGMVNPRLQQRKDSPIAFVIWQTKRGAECCEAFYIGKNDPHQQSSTPHRTGRLPVSDEQMEQLLKSARESARERAQTDKRLTGR